MADELIRRGFAPMQREAQRHIVHAAARTQIAQARMRAMSATTEFAMSEVAYLTRIKGELQQACPDATEALAFIAHTAGIAIARSVNRFGSELL